MLNEKVRKMADKMHQSDIHLSLYRMMLIIGAGLSVFCIIGNFIGAFPLMASLKWAVLLVITVAAFFLSNSKKYTHYFMFGLFIFIICIFLPFAFLDSGGSRNNAIGYIFLILITVTYLFSSWKRIFLVSMLVVVFVALTTLDYFHPELITVYPEWNQFVDAIIQIPCTLIISFLILLRFAREYERTNHELGALANYDALTGLYNRRVFNDAMAEAAQYTDQPVHLAMMDLDHFKNINDNHGHHIGDAALMELAKLFKNYFDLDEQIVSRWGGDEFAIIYYGDKDELIHKLDAVKDAFYTYAKSYEEMAGISTSIVSFGDYATKTDALIAADHMLYAEKSKKHILDHIPGTLAHKNKNAHAAPDISRKS